LQPDPTHGAVQYTLNTPNSSLKETADPKMKILTLSFCNTLLIPANLIMLSGVDFQIQEKIWLKQKGFYILVGSD